MNRRAVGTLIRQKRLAAELTLRGVAATMGFSHVFLSMVERGRTSLPKRHWGRLASLIPGLTAGEIRKAAALDQPTTLAPGEVAQILAILQGVQDTIEHEPSASRSYLAAKVSEAINIINQPR